MLKQDSGWGLCLCSKPARYKPDRVLCHLKLRRLSGIYRELSFSLRQLCIISHSDPSLPAMVHLLGHRLLLMLPLQAHSHRFFTPENSIDTIMPDKVLRQQRGDVLPWVIGGAVAAVAIGAVIYLATTPPPSQKKQYYTVTVEVIDATTGNPVNGATVSLDSFTSQTDSTGVAVLTNVPAGTYLLTVMASGYQQYISSEVISGDTAIPVQLASTTTQPPPTSITPVARVVDPATGAYLTSD